MFVKFNPMEIYGVGLDSKQMFKGAQLNVSKIWVKVIGLKIKYT